jgi:hypothetical protein
VSGYIKISASCNLSLTQPPAFTLSFETHIQCLLQVHAVCCHVLSHLSILCFFPRSTSRSCTVSGSQPYILSTQRVLNDSHGCSSSLHPRRHEYLHMRRSLDISLGARCMRLPREAPLCVAWAHAVLQRIVPRSKLRHGCRYIALSSQQELWLIRTAVYRRRLAALR